MQKELSSAAFSSEKQIMADSGINELNCLSATDSSTSSDDSGSDYWIDKSSSSDRSDDSSSDDGMSRQFTAPEARDFIVSRLRDQERFEDYLNRFVEWDDIDGLNEKADLTAAAKSIMKETRWYGIYRATKEEIQAADLLRRRHH